MSKAIVAMFDSRADADRAADVLAQQGFQRADIKISRRLGGGRGVS